MIRSYFGLSKNPFSNESISLLDYQQEIYDILMVHATQGGLCLLMGEPGTGKSVIKQELRSNTDKRYVFATISRSMHTYTNTIKQLCDAFNIEFTGTSYSCEKRLIEAAHTLYSSGKTLIIIIDDAHLLDITILRKIRLLLEDFPDNHNLILVGQPELLNNMSLKVHEDIKSRVTYSVILKKITNELIEKFIYNQLDLVGLPHSTFTEESLHLLIRSSDGILRRIKNLVLGCLIEAVRGRTQNISLDITNKVLMQPHWRKEMDIRPL